MHWQKEECFAIDRHAKKIIHRGQILFKTHLLEAIILIAVGTVPAVPVPIGHHCVLITEPAVHICMDGLLSVNKRSCSDTMQLGALN